MDIGKLGKILYKMIIFNVTVLKISENVYYQYISAKFVKNQKYCSIAEKKLKSNIVTIVSIIS